MAQALPVKGNTGKASATLSLSNIWVCVAMISMVQVAAVHVPFMQSWLTHDRDDFAGLRIVLLLASPFLVIGERLKQINV